MISDLKSEDDSPLLCQVRNSWGTYWGLNDWFLIERGNNAVLIEEHCYFGVPTWDKPQQ